MPYYRSLGDDASFATAAVVKQAAQAGGLAKVVAAAGGEDRIDVIAGLLIGAARAGLAGPGAAIVRQTTAAERFNLLGSAQFRASAGASFPAIASMIAIAAPGTPAGRVTPGAGPTAITDAMRTSFKKALERNALLLGAGVVAVFLIVRKRRSA